VRRCFGLRRYIGQGGCWCREHFKFPLRIAIITSGLEPGRDGVGDYSTGLAAELRLLGHDVIVIGLSDKFVSEVISTGRQIEGVPIQALRLPSKLPWPERIQRAGRMLDAFDPEWVSLQFVCYAFHPKGLIYGLSWKLAPLLKGRKLHIMFHEIWLCKETGWGWKQRAVGVLQRFWIQCFVRAVKPNVMHTSNAAYASLLNRSGVPVTELGLFGNVPVLPEPRTAWIESQLRSVLGSGYRREDVWLFGFFGAIHAQWTPEPLLTQLHRAAQAAGKKPVILSIGSTGQGGSDLWDCMAQDYGDHFAFLRLGRQSSEIISEYLSFLDCGIATTPRSIIGKSGSVTAMIEHGLPIIVNRDGTPCDERTPPKSNSSFIPCNVELETRLRTGLERGPRESRRPHVARAFAFALQQATTPLYCLI
jgi:hypothetical protein